MLVFVPTGLSFSCEAEFLSFHRFQERFDDFNCTVVFAATETKHDLWHWTNIPREYGGVGLVKIPLVSDTSRSMCRVWGVIAACKEEGEELDNDLRGMYIVDEAGILRQVRSLF